jgi:hypothetical protein
MWNVSGSKSISWIISIFPQGIKKPSKKHLFEMTAWTTKAKPLPIGKGFNCNGM